VEFRGSDVHGGWPALSRVASG